MKPFVKWAGGKRQILSTIIKFIKESINESDVNSYTYIEPFLGGGAVFFELKPERAIINDLNSDLINAYRVIKSNQYIDLINSLKEYEQAYRKDSDDFYYETRRKDRELTWIYATPLERATRMIFLNKTCYNGLYRVNGKGEFNTPIGRYSNPTICDEQTIKEIHDYLSDDKNKISIMNESYEKAIDKAKDGDIIYVDPPYDYQDDDGFTKYQMKGFSFSDFETLKECCDKAIDKGAIVIISNNATDKVVNLFLQDSKYRIFYNLTKISTLRMINCKANSRHTGEEVLIWGMSNSLPQAKDINQLITFACKCNDEYLKDITRIKNDLKLGSERQVAYYLSALQFLNYITQQHTVSQNLLQFNGNRDFIEKDIFNQLKKKNIFQSLYLKSKDQLTKVSRYEIEEEVSKRYSSLSHSTVVRRASTIRAWLEWMLEYSKTNCEN